MSNLLNEYSGDKAVNYEAIRTKSPRWKSEVQAMEKLLSATSPKVVLDCPFGTGRWIPQYQAIGAEIIGIDLSEGMLKEAEDKLKSTGNTKILKSHLIKGSIFDIQASDLPVQPDLIACIRFVNWISFDDLEKTVSVLSKLPAKKMILGASVIPSEASTLQRMKLQAALKVTNFRTRDKPPQYVHEEQALINLLKNHQWKVIEKLPIFKNASRTNYFYQLERD